MSIEQTCNNGGGLAQHMHNIGVLGDGMNWDIIRNKAIELNLMLSDEHLDGDSFAEEFFIRCEELGYESIE